MMSREIGVVVVAAGRGLRMGGEIPKQYICIAGKPILIHTLSSLLHLGSDLPIVVVVPSGDVGYMQELCRAHLPEWAHIKVVSGGAERSDSVRCGLAALPEHCTHVAVHDGVRPLVSGAVWERLLASQADVVVPVVRPVDSIRLREGTGSVPIDRSRAVCVQTPQLISRDKLVQAYREAPSDRLFTDDASLVECVTGSRVELVEGDSKTLKITTPMDLVLFEYLLKEELNG